MRGRSRIDALDALRGFALAGVCVANLPLFAGRDDLARSLGLDAGGGPADMASRLVMGGLVEGRFMTLFSMMFGLGMALMIARIRASGRRSWSVLVRRLAFLAAVGFLHGAYIWSGDVLLLYGAVGLLCLPVLLRSTRWVWGLFWASSAVIAVGGVITTVLGSRLDIVPVDEGEAATWLASLTRAHETGDHWGVLSIGGQAPVPDGTAAISAVFLVVVIARTAWLFAVGALAHRYSLIERLHLGDPLGRRALVLGLAVGVPSAAVDVWGVLAGDSLASLIGPGLLAFTVGGAFMSVAYAVLFLTWWRSAASSPVAVGLRSLGRVAFSAYLTQSLLGVTAFTLLGLVGLSLWGDLSGFGMIVWGLGTIAVQCVLAWWWLRRFSLGPLEGLWRAVTYWQRPRWKG